MDSGPEDLEVALFQNISENISEILIDWFLRAEYEKNIYEIHFVMGIYPTRKDKEINKKKYFDYKSLKKVRYNRSAEELCSAVEVVDISGMDWAPTYCPSNLPLEVLEWQKQDQIAYWKSRAISLELENKMLRQHLRNVYAKTIEDESSNNHINTTVGTEETMEDVGSVPTKNSNHRTCSNVNHEQQEVLPIIPENKNRLEEMQRIYGARAQKLMGMETAIQLNYERHLEQSKPVVWPSLPLNLKFE
ncbi:unnamed protein product [Phaedon cochleariae]|uniref:Uncharacterized protein n=1 Tax=Phaedon cochleariae TaxID=80249 RepID=A0A9N9SF17_PHACE|nr:unnamed protein product [Phaedon cochleariae]